MSRAQSLLKSLLGHRGPLTLSQSCYGTAEAARRSYVAATTILSVRKDGQVVIVGDGQATSNDFIIKPNVQKIRTIGKNIIGGFAGGAADGITLFERLEAKVEEHPGQLQRAAVELAKMWRQEKTLRMLEAQLIVADRECTLMVVGNGDVLEPHDGVMGIGSGGAYAEAAARALWDLPGQTAMSIAKKAMQIAADCCVYTNHNYTWETLPPPAETSKEKPRSTSRSKRA